MLGSPESEIAGLATDAGRRRELDRPLLSRTVRRFVAHWENLPLYGTRSVAPLALAVLNLSQFALLLAVISIGWYQLRSSFVSLRWVLLLSILNHLLVSTVTNTLIAAGFAVCGRFTDALVALFWPAIVEVLAFLSPARDRAAIEQEFWAQLRRDPSGRIRSAMHEHK